MQETQQQPKAREIEQADEETDASSGFQVRSNYNYSLEW